MTRLLLSLLLLLPLALTGCPPAGGDDDDSATGDDDDATGDDDDATGDDDDSSGDDDDATGDDDDSAGDDDDDSAGDDDDDDGTQAAFAPEAGDYDYGLINFSVNECAAGQSNIGTGIEILNVGTDTYQMDSTDDSVPLISCYFDQTMAFVCDPTSSSFNLSAIGLPNATIARSDTNSPGGSWTSTTSVSLNNSITMNCSGSQCGVAGQVLGIATFPCTSTYSTTATLIE